MHLLQWVRRDLVRPGRPVDRNKWPFLAAVSVVVVTAAQWNEPGTGLDLGLLILAGAALTAWPLLPRCPAELLAAAVLTPVVLAVGRQGHLELSLFLVVMVTLYASWHLGSTVRTALIALVCCLAIPVASTRIPDSFTAPPWIAAEVFTSVLGRTLFRQRELIAELAAAREALAERAVMQERQRIARELHDLSGHTLAAMLLHVTGARHVLRRDAAEADRALQDAEAVGRASMDQIRATVAALRTTERGTDPAAPDGVADGVGDLVAGYRNAGLAIDSDLDHGLAQVCGPVAVALHRICREALANVARHAPANTVVVSASIDRPGGPVRLVIRDRGRRPARVDSGGLDSGGFGLTGMRERARALGGTLHAGPTADGWSVEAVLPWPGRGTEEGGER